MNVEGRAAIVTGASSGIGAATARALHQQGALVVMAARREDRLRALAQELRGAVTVRADVTHDADRHRIVDECARAFGRVDVLVNNAGRGLHVRLEDVDLDAFRDVLELNVVAPLAMMQLVLPHMRAQGAGAIVNVSSGTTRMVLPGVGAYASTKSALNQLSQTARAELADDGIVVSTLLPGVTNTEFPHAYRQGAAPERARMYTQGHAPEAVAAAVLELIQQGDAEQALSLRPA